MSPKRKTKQWDRVLWAAHFSCPGTFFLVGESWREVQPAIHPSDPLRLLLFTTRKAAREWCAAKRNEWSRSPVNFDHWRITAVRVRETVKAV